MMSIFCLQTWDHEIAWGVMKRDLVYGDDVEVNGELFRVIAYRIVLVRGDEPTIKYLLETVFS